MLNLSSSSSLPSIQKLFSHFFHMPFGLVVMAPSSNFNVISDAFAHGTHLHRVVVCICATIDKTVQRDEEEEENPRLLLRNPSKTDRLMLCARRVEFSSFSFIVVVVRHHHRQHNRHTIFIFRRSVLVPQTLSLYARLVFSCALIELRLNRTHQKRLKINFLPFHKQRKSHQ